LQCLAVKTGDCGNSETRGDGSGAGKNLKVGAHEFFCRPPPFFGSTSTISRYGERFRSGQYRLVSFLFAVFYSRCPPPCPAICKSGNTGSRKQKNFHIPPCRIESATLGNGAY